MAKNEIKSERFVFPSNYTKAPKKLSKFFLIAISVPKSILELSTRSFLDKAIVNDRLIKCIVSIDPTNYDDSVVLYRIYLDVSPTNQFKWKSEQVYNFFNCILNGFIQDRENWNYDNYVYSKCFIKIIKPEKQDRAIKWATTDCDSCFTSHFD
jgi:hypothetical protein